MVEIVGDDVPDCELKNGVPLQWVQSFLHLWTAICDYVRGCEHSCPLCKGAGCRLLEFRDRKGELAEPIIRTTCLTPRCKGNELTPSTSLDDDVRDGCSICM